MKQAADSINQKPSKRRSPWTIILLTVVGLLVVLFLAIQLIPVNRTNPPATAEINWDSPQTQALASQACMDCHSNATVWPWYSHIAPASWLVYYDVQTGRSKLNFSTFTPGQEKSAMDASDASDLAYRLGGFIANLGSSGMDDDAAGGGLAKHLEEHLTGGEMPPAKYLLMHPMARLTDAQKQQLLTGLINTLGLQMGVK